MRTRPILFIVLTMVLATTACSDPVKNGSFTLHAIHEVNGQPLVTNELCYTNEAGNPYLVNEVQWFLSHIEIKDDQGRWTTLAETWYIDTNLPESQTLKVANVPAGNYQTLRFTFGLSDTDNLSGTFSNPPECNMFWPDELGGGYHYMKLNGKYQNAENLLAPLAIHLGRGQNPEHSEFYDNSFMLELPIELIVTEDHESHLGLIMNIEKWFRDPNVYDFNAFGSAIMQNQQAQLTLKANGHNVFSIKNTEDMESALKTAMDILHMAAPKPHFMTWENIKSTFKNIKNPKKQQ